MIVDGRSDTSPSLPEYDLVIVGSGPAGTTVAHELVGSGLRIAVLESGGLEFDGDTQELYDGAVTGLDEVDLMAIRLRMLGGTSNHWGGNCLPLDNIDFERAPLSGMTGWPFNRATLMPFYERAHPYLDLGAVDYDTYAPRGVSAGNLLLPDNPVVDNAVLRISANPPTRFGEKYRPLYETEQTIDLWLWTNLVGLNISPSGQVTGIETATLLGQTRQFKAKRVVLACGAVENARQLMLANLRNGTSFGDSGGFLGTCYMDHPTGGSGFVWPHEALNDKVNWAQDLVSADGTDMRYVWRLHEDVLERERLSNAQFYVIPYSSDSSVRQRKRDAWQGYQGLKSLAKWTLNREGHNFSLSRSYCNFITNADAMAGEYLFPRGAVNRMLLKYETEQQPDKASRITLTETQDRLGLPLPNLHWSPSEDDRQSVIRTTELIGQAVGAADLGRLAFEDGRDERYWNMVTSWHQLGTTRMSVAPSDGVVNENALVHGTQNLFVAGGSIMPTGGRANPTLTITALSIRLADHLRTEGSRG
ncbi:MAG: GMC family oxidoreductase [Pseudomonadota bacterium]